MAIPLLSFTPAFTILTSFLILKEIPSERGILGIILVVIGAYILNSESISFKKIFEPLKRIISKKELVYALIVAFLYSISTNYDKVVVLNSDQVFGAAATCFFVALLLTILLLTKKDVSFKAYKGNLPNAALGGIFNAVSLIFINTALTMQIVPYVSSIKRTAVLFGVLYGMLLFREKNIGKRFLGAFIMVVGAVLIIFY